MSGEATGRHPRDLTPREREVVKLMSSGLAISEIARRLGSSVQTVRTQVKTVYRKLGAHDADSAVKAAILLDLIP